MLFSLIIVDNIEILIFKTIFLNVWIQEAWIVAILQPAVIRIVDQRCIIGKLKELLGWELVSTGKINKIVSSL